MSLESSPDTPLDMADVRTWFNANAHETRVIALMSPTCGFCQIGHKAYATLFAWLDGAPLAGLRVWSPWFPADTPESAAEESGTFTDARVADRWDGTRVLGKAFAATLGLRAPAWDTYVIYAPGIEWAEGEDPSAPTLWQHQLWEPWGAPPENYLSPSRLWWSLIGLVGWERKEFIDAGAQFVDELARSPSPERLRITSEE